MAKVSNTFHTSKKNHAIASAAKLAAVELHNDRGYSHWTYSADKICDLIDSQDTLSNAVKKYINDTFNPEIEAYNGRQKQACRRISTDAFTYFCENKNLDIANEMILQVGDKEFWDAYRLEKTIQTAKGKKFIIKDFPEPVKDVMNGIFKEQLQAYENIYETEKETILAKIRVAKEEAEAGINSLDPELKKEFIALEKKKGKVRAAELDQLDPEKKEKFLIYLEQHTTSEMIKKLRLIERIEAGQMKIKVIGGKGHYDEDSPHAHGVSVCWAEGYKTGLSSRVAKSVVLNKFTLEVIQDKMREIARAAIEKNQDIFLDVELAQKGKGRNFDYTVEQFISQKKLELQNQLTRVQKELDVVEESRTRLQLEIEPLKAFVDSFPKEPVDLKNVDIPLKGFGSGKHYAVPVSIYEDLVEVNDSYWAQKLAKYKTEQALIAKEEEYNKVVARCDQLIKEKKELKDSISLLNQRNLFLSEENRLLWEFIRRNGDEDAFKRWRSGREVAAARQPVQEPER